MPESGDVDLDDLLPWSSGIPRTCRASRGGSVAGYMQDLQGRDDDVRSGGPSRGPVGEDGLAWSWPGGLPVKSARVSNGQQPLKADLVGRKDAARSRRCLMSPAPERVDPRRSAPAMVGAAVRGAATGPAISHRRSHGTAGPEARHP